MHRTLEHRDELQPTSYQGRLSDVSKENSLEQKFVKRSRFVCLSTTFQSNHQQHSHLDIVVRVYGPMHLLVSSRLLRIANPVSAVRLEVIVRYILPLDPDCPCLRPSMTWLVGAISSDESSYSKRFSEFRLVSSSGSLRNLFSYEAGKNNSSCINVEAHIFLELSTSWWLRSEPAVAKSDCTL